MSAITPTDPKSTSEGDEPAVYLGIGARDYFLGKEGQRLRDKGLSWRDIGKRMGICRNRIIDHVAAYCAAAGLQPPYNSRPYRAQNAKETRAAEKRAYEAAKTDEPWAQVAEREGCAVGSVVNRARRYAKRHKLPWPLRTNPGDS